MINEMPFINAELWIRFFLDAPSRRGKKLRSLR